VPTDRSEAATASATPRVGLRNQPGDYFERFVLRAAPRWFKVHVPPGYQSGDPMPLVFNLHGLGMNLEEQEALSGMTAKADEVGFVLVHPQAGASVWNIQAGEIGAIDVEFFRQMIDLLLERLSIDPERIYVTGFSNGGGMAHRLACDLSDRVAAIAPVAGAYLQDEICVPRRPVPILAIHGLADRYAPFLDPSVGQDVPRWALVWAARNGCDQEPLAEVRGAVTVETWRNCRNDASVILYRVEEMGHSWPGSPLGDRYGPGTEELQANDLIWDFFQAHTLSGSP
jgi:polyhydroxybutyrate depolymerase